MASVAIGFGIPYSSSKRRPPPPQPPPPPKPRVDAVAELLKTNQGAFDAIINHPFPRALGNGTASLDGFRYYMIVSQMHPQYAFIHNRVARQAASGGLRPPRDDGTS